MRGLRTTKNASVREEIAFSFILDYRKVHPRRGKEKLKNIVDKFCLERGLKPVSISTIERIIRYLKERGYFEGKKETKLLC